MKQHKDSRKISNLSNNQLLGRPYVVFVFGEYVRQQGGTGYNALIDDIAENIGARISSENRNLQSNVDRLRKDLNRRAAVEEVLLDVAYGRRDMLTKEECRELAHKLGIPLDDPALVRQNKPAP